MHSIAMTSTGTVEGQAHSARAENTRLVLSMHCKEQPPGAPPPLSPQTTSTSRGAAVCVPLIAHVACVVPYHMAARTLNINGMLCCFYYVIVSSSADNCMFIGPTVGSNMKKRCLQTKTQAQHSQLYNHSNCTTAPSQTSFRKLFSLLQ